MGGSDQWGNIVTGSEMIRKIDQGSAFAVTTQLIKKSDGQKFGKTESGAVWLDPKKTSPYKYYQFWLNASDDDAKNWIKIFTLKTKEEIEALILKHEEAPHLRLVQKALAEDITIRTHSQAAYDLAVKTSDFLFGNGSLSFLSELSEQEVLEVFDGVPLYKINQTTIQEGTSILDLLATHTTIFPSKGEARKMLQGGGVSLNREKLTDIEQIITQDYLINNQYLVVQRGKKNYYLIQIK